VRVTRTDGKKPGGPFVGFENDIKVSILLEILSAVEWFKGL